MTIAEASKLYDISADTLRYYERVGLLPPVSRNESGHRNYSEEDGNWIHFIKCMRSAGISVETLIEYVSLFQEGSSTISVRKDLLIEQREKLAVRVADLQEVLERLDKKIDGYEERMIKCEQELKLW